MTTRFHDSLAFERTIQVGKLVTQGVAKCKITHADLTTAGTSQVLTFNTLAVGVGDELMPATSRVMYAWINIITPFSGGSVSALTVKLGDAGSDNELITNVSVFTGASGLKTKTGSYALGTYEAAYAPILTFTSTDDNVVSLDAGEIEVLIQYETLSTAAATG